MPNPPHPLFDLPASIALTQHIHESNLIENIDDPKADSCGLVAWVWLNIQPSITPDVILNLHTLVTAAQPDPEPVPSYEWRGAWRQDYVRVGGHLCPPPDTVPKAIEVWCGRRPDLTPRDAHIQFERIHPFRDGNGRVGRLLMWRHEQDLNIPPTLIPSSDRVAYYRWFA